jgi:hypothetical protein
MKSFNRDDKMYIFLVTSVAFALFIVCPRMAGMTNIITNATNTNIVQIAVIGTILAIPLIVAMVLIFKQYGLIPALAFSVLTDIAAALVIKEISFKAGLETLIIALFVIAGVKVASIVSHSIS